MPRDPSKIEDLLPHRGLMKLIDEIVELTSERAVVTTRVREDWPMADEECVPALALLEVSAQTAGLVCELRLGLEDPEPQMGYLVGVRKCSFFVSRVKIGSELTARAEMTFWMDEYAVLGCEVHGREELLCRAEVQLVGT